MATSADISWEENLTAHWMSSASRAGVILNPCLPSLRTSRAVNIENASLSFAVNSLCSSSCASLSEDSLHGEDASESCSPCEEQLDAAKTPFPFTLAKKQPVLMVKEGPAPCKALQNDSECSQQDDMHERCCKEPLTQKLEQLKGLQQLKQEELKRQQMEQIQRLREEQQKLLSLVSEQQAHTGVAVTEDDSGRQYSQSARLSPAPYFLPCRGGNSVSWDSTSCVSPAGQKDPLQILSDDQISKGISSGDPSYENQLFEMQNKLEAADKTSISGSSGRSPEPNLGGSVDGSNNSESPRNVETGQRCLEIPRAEERPIPTSIQERKLTFQELLEEQIRLEEQRLIQKGNRKDVGRSTFQRAVPKQPFLKRGEGLTRFAGAKSKAAKQKESKITVHPNPSEASNTVKADKPQLHRKIAPLNKEHISDNSVPKKGNQFAKSKKGSALPAQKTATQRNSTGKGTPLSTRQNSSEKKVGPLRDSVGAEKNKENLIELAKLNEAGSKSFGETQRSPAESTQALCHPRGLSDCSEKDSELSFELSFQKKLKNWDADKEKEKIELDEFLFLEQAADEISFASNSSLILKILDQGQQISTGHRMSSTPIKSKQPQQRLEALDVTDVHKREDLPSQQASKERDRGPAAESQAPVILKDHLNKADTEMLWAFPTAHFQDFRNTGWDEDNSDGNSETTSDSEEEFETTIKLAREEPKGLALNNRGGSPAYSECRGQDKGASRGANLNLLEKDLTSSQSSEIIADSAPESQSVCSANRNKVEFDDERSWSDFEEHGRLHAQVPSIDVAVKAPPPTDHSAWTEAFFPDKVTKRKIATMKKGDALAKPSVADSEVTAPPTTDLMLKLFPSLRLKPKGDVQQRPEIKPNMGQGEPADTARSQLLREKLVELETEIERFRVENASLAKLREEHESSLENLRKETVNFEQQKAKELAQIEEMKKEEMRKLQKERKVFEKYSLAARAIPDKKERDEIQALKQQVATLQEDLKRREAKWSTTHMRLRDQIEALTRENTELREEIKVMERFRLEAWKRQREAANNRKVDSCGVYSKTAAEIEHAPAVLQKSQNVSLVPQAEKSNKTNGKGDLPPEGRHSSRSTLAVVPKESYLDNPAMTHEDSSKTFMVTSKSFPGNVPVETSTPTTPVYIDSEEETQNEVSHPDGKVEKILKDGSHLIFFPNGTRKEVSCDGKTTTVTFFNGDIKQVLEDQRVIYYYADAKTTHTTYPTGLEVLHFSNGQTEKYFPDGRKEIVFPDQIVKNIFPDGQEENIFPDGTIIRIQQDGSKTIEFNNGQEELHTAHFKRRKYPDGTTKTIYANGCQETKYASGRVRVKDKDGKVIMDTFPQMTVTSH
ncbi:PREDICTED: centromere protein J [Gekko japonicus]|uniref:Centromere protein J n=1 Tax=Gekko japonicus TaxID=146911 RepID=A0ABM1LG79_GEKJA|nr:PREDICTED: centromere protein J [Gekko japonicus]